MRRKAPGIEAAVVFHRDAVYTREQVRSALGLAVNTLRREIRLGRLVPSKIAGRYYLRGIRVLQWLRGMEVRRRKRPAAASTNGFAGKNGEEER